MILTAKELETVKSIYMSMRTVIGKPCLISFCQMCHLKKSVCAPAGKLFLKIEEIIKDADPAWLDRLDHTVPKAVDGEKSNE